MRLFPFFPLLVLAFSTASASSTAFSIDPGDCHVYFVQSSSTPTVDVDQGDVTVRSIVLIPPNLWRIELCCEASSPVTCEGWIRH